MRRQVGADTVELDTRESYARYGILEPTRIDFDVLEKAVYGAGYTLTVVLLELDGTAERAHCAICDAERLQLDVAGTDQRFCLDGEGIPVGQQLRVKASASGWADQHPRLRILEHAEGGG